MKRKITVQIFTHSLHLISDESDEHIDNALAKIQEIIKQINEKFPLINESKVLALTSMILALENIQMQKQLSGYMEEREKFIVMISSEVNI